MKRVVLEESQFIRLAAHCRLHIQIIVLIGAARGRCIHKPFAVDGNVRPRAVKRLLGQHCLRLRDAVLDSRNPQHIARPQRYIAIGHEQQLFAAWQPRRREVHIPAPEIESTTAEVVIAAHRNRIALPVTVIKAAHVEVEIATMLSRHIGDFTAVWREHRVSVDRLIVGKLAHLAGERVQNLELNTLVRVICGVNEPASIGREVG